MKKKIEKEIINSMNKNPNNWKGIFYVNSKDPRIIVPKINPLMGWTLNFGHKITVVGMILIILIMVAYQVLISLQENMKITVFIISLSICISGQFAQDNIDLLFTETEIVLKTPDFELIDTNGKKFFLNDFKGEYLLIDVW